MSIWPTRIKFMIHRLLIMVGFENQSMSINLTYRLPIVRPRAQQFLKLLALGLMIADHVHYVFFNHNLE
jgi:hypothetical protein